MCLKHPSSENLSPVMTLGTTPNGGRGSQHISVIPSVSSASGVETPHHPTSSFPTTKTDLPLLSDAGRAGPPGSSSLDADSDPPQYPPTKVEIYQTCPRLWWYTEKGWIPRSEPWTPNALIGQAVQEGLNILWTPPNLRTNQSPEEAMQAELDREWNPDQDVWMKDAVMNHIRKGFELGKSAQLDSNVTIISLNQMIHGRKPDVVARLPGGGLRVIDIKVSLSLTRDKLHWRQVEWNHSWQLRDYAWFCQEYFQEQVTELAICQISIGPKPFVIVYPVDVSPEILDQWYESAKQYWRQMWYYMYPHKLADFEAPTPPMNTRACNMKSLHYGRDRCPMYDGCHQYYGDESKFDALFYNRKESL